MNKLDQNTFGGSPAAIKLAEILSETDDINLVARVSRKLGSFNRILAELTKLDGAVNIAVAHIVYKAYLALPINDDKTKVPLPEKVKSFVDNMITTRFRIWMNENKGRIPKKIRIEKD